MPKIPNAILEDLKCKHCKRWISCGPVYVLPQGNSLCGRCESIAIKQYRHTAFEALAGHFHYPCQYYSRHCPELLPWNFCLEHEEDCSYQSFCGTLCAHPSVIFKKERKLDVSEEVRCEYLPDYILEYLKCSLCESYLSCPPIYVRPDGKSVCHRCVTSNGLPPDTIRHFAFETLADAAIFPCIYRTRGCTQYFKFGPDMWNHEIDCSYGIVRSSSGSSQKGKKERGVIATHSGHVYGTITPNSLHLFVPPPLQNGKKVVKEEEDRFVKALKKQQQKFSKSDGTLVEEEVKDPRSTPSSTKSSEHDSVFSFNNHNLPRIDPQKLNTSPAYQNNLSRNESIYSTTSSVITELKARQEQRKRTESPTDSVKDEQKVIANIDDALWVYDEVVTEYKNRHSHLKNKPLKAI